MVGSFWASIYFDRTANPFWNNYFSNIAVTCLSFVIAIFVIEALQKRKERKAWQPAETIINYRIKAFVYRFSLMLSGEYGYNIDEFLDPNSRKEDFDKSGVKALKGLKAHLQSSTVCSKYSYMGLISPITYDSLEGIIFCIPMIPDRAELTGKLLEIDEYYKKSAKLLRVKLNGGKYKYMGSIKEAEKEDLKKNFCKIIDLCIELYQ